MVYVDVHTHSRGEGISVLDISGGRGEARGGLCSMGIHPLSAGDGRQLGRIREAAERGEIAAVGEAGLDRNAEIPVGAQLGWFEEEVRIAEECGLPLIIHCVRAYPELLSVHKRLRPRAPWIIHGYDNNGEILARLLACGFYISAGKRLFVPRSNIRGLLPRIPAERLFLETDDSDMPVGAVYREAAEVLGISPEELAGRVYGNFRRVFQKV